jgi:hypothetical protein
MSYSVSDQNVTHNSGLRERVSALNRETDAEEYVVRRMKQYLRLFQVLGG